MIKIENTEIIGWEAAIRGMSCNKGVRQTNSGKFEAYVTVRGNFVSCGTYKTEEEAREAVIFKRIQLFKSNIIANDDEPLNIVESVEKGYFASPKGNIYNQFGVLMIGSIDRHGYRHCILNGKNHNIHRIIAQTFIPNPNNFPCVNHKDGNKLNNSIDNLEWCTHSDNTSHAYREGLEKKQTGEEHHNHKLTWDDVHYIRDVYEKGSRIYGSAALGRLFGVDKSTVSAIVHNETWREQNDKN